MEVVLAEDNADEWLGVCDVCLCVSFFSFHY